MMSFLKIKNKINIAVIIAVFWVLFLLFYRVDYSQAQRYEYLDLKRFLLTGDELDRSGADPRMKKVLIDFSKKMNLGITLIHQNRIKEARKNLLEAAAIWPEYYGTYFVLAVSYELTGNIKKAARYYKTYLEHLKDFHTGKYKISGPIIRFLYGANIERYGFASDNVTSHLADMDIDINNVRPIVIMSPIWRYSIVVFILVFLYLIAAYMVFPYLKRRARVMNPPDGFWVCPNCGEENPVLRHECNECRRPRGE